MKSITKIRSGMMNAMSRYKPGRIWTIRRLILVFITCFFVIGCKSGTQINAEEVQAAQIRSSSTDNVKDKVEHLEKAVAAKPDDYISKFRLATLYPTLGGKSNFDKAYAMCTDVSKNAPQDVLKKSATRMLKDMKEKPNSYMEGNFDSSGKFKEPPTK